MKKGGIHQLIEEQDKEKKTEMYHEFEKKHNITAEEPVGKRRTLRIVSCAAAAAVIICLIVAVPLIVNSGTKNPTRYSDLGDFFPKDMDCTVRDYAVENNLDLLYIDWYDNADEIHTKLYINKDDKVDISFLQETIVNSRSGSIVDLYIMKQNIEVDSMVRYEEQCDKNTTIKGLAVNWNYNKPYGVAYFNYEGYKYYIILEDISDKSVINDAVEDMIKD